jgi:hypothetical protein
MLLFTGIAGPGVWIHPLFEVNGTIISLNHFAFAFSIAFSLITIGQNVHKVLSLRTRSMPLYNTTLQLLPFTILIIASAIWGATEHELLITHPHNMMMALSLVFAYITSRLIVNRVCKEPTQLSHGILIPTIIVALIGIINDIRGSHGGALVVADVLLTLAGIQFVYFSVCVIRQLTSHLGIHAFKIVPVDPSRQRPPPPPQQGAGSPLLESQNNLEIQVDEPGAHSIE